MSNEFKCPECGSVLPADAPAGLCPACLMALNLKPETVMGGEAAPAQAPLPPEQLAPHFPQLEILECLGRGGMGVVYKARQKSLNRLVALKLLAPERAGDPQFAARFEKEARALAALNHPNIVTIYDHGQAGGYYFLLMEFVDGATLRQLLAKQRLSPREALAIVPQICDALQFAHDQGIVHRDIKPENILLDRRGRVKVADFGLAKIISNDAALNRSADTLAPNGGEGRGAGASPVLTDASKVMGTPQYMSPEQVQAPGAVDHRADIYALGVVFYQMLTGELPAKPIEPPSGKVQIDVRLDAVVLRALEKDPELRYQQAGEIKTIVETIVATGGDGGNAAPAAKPFQPTGNKPATNNVALVTGVLVLVGVLVLLIAVGVFFGYRSYLKGARGKEQQRSETMRSEAIRTRAHSPDVSVSATDCTLTVKLRDGSQLSGKCLADPLVFRSPTLGKLKLAVASIRTIEVASDGETARLTAANNEQFTVFFAMPKLPLETSFGRTELPVSSIRSIKVRRATSQGKLPEGLVALWSGEGNGADLIGEHNAVAQGNASYEPGLVGQAFGLDGRTAYWKIPASQDLDVGAGDGLTITAWVRPSAFDELGNGARGPIIEWDSDSDDGVSLWVSGDNSLMGHLKTRTADGRSSGLQTAARTLHSGEWQSVAFTFDKQTGAASLYVNGALVKSDNFGNIRAVTQYPINIGRRTGQPVGNGDSYGGLVDELALYNRALSAAEIQAIYQAVPLPKSPRPDTRTSDPATRLPPKLIGWWPLNEGEGAVAHDNSGNQPPHDGQILGGPNQEIWDNSERGQESLVCDGRRYVDLGNIFQDQFEAITIACWIKNSGSGWQDVVERASWGTADGIALTMEWQGKSAAFGHYEQAVNTRACVQDRQWHHLAGTMRRSGADYVYSIYVDGKLDNSATNAWGLSATTGKWTIGAREGGSWSYHGLVNDVRLYDGALGEADIRKIFEEKKYQPAGGISAPRPAGQGVKPLNNATRYQQAAQRIPPPSSAPQKAGFTQTATKPAVVKNSEADKILLRQQTATALAAANSRQSASAATTAPQPAGDVSGLQVVETNPIRSADPSHGDYLQWVCLAIIVIGGLIFLFGQILFLIVVFRDSVAWGLACIFVPIAALYYLVTNWEETQSPFIISLIGAVICGGGLFWASFH